MVESHKLPKIALSAANLLRARFETDLNALGSQAVEAMGFTDDANWHVDFDAGTLSREIPDPPKDPASEAPSEEPAKADD